MSPDKIWEEIDAELSRLTQNQSVAPFHPLIERLIDDSSRQSPSYPPEFYRTFIALVQQMGKDVEGGSDVRDVLNQAIQKRGSYSQPDWDVNNVFQSSGQTFQLILNNFRSDIDPQPPWYKSISGQLTLAVCILIALATGGYYLISPYYTNPKVTKPNPARDSQIGILVAEFSEGASADAPTDRTVTQTIIDQLNSEFPQQTSQDASRRAPDVVIIPLGKVINPLKGDETAINIGKEYGATVIVWGWYSKSDTKVLINAKFQVLDSPFLRSGSRKEEAKAINEVLGKSMLENFQKHAFELSDLQSFDLHFDLSNNIALLSRFTVGLLYYLQRDYQPAIRSFEAASTFKAGQENKVGLEAIYYFLGNALYFASDSDEAKLKAINSLKSAAAIYGALGNRQSNYAHKIHNNLGVIYTQLGERRIEDAKSEFRLAIKIKPDYAEAYANLGVINYRQGEVGSRNKELGKSYRTRTPAN